MVTYVTEAMLEKACHSSSGAVWHAAPIIINIGIIHPSILVVATLLPLEIGTAVANNGTSTEGRSVMWYGLCANDGARYIWYG